MVFSCILPIDRENEDIGTHLGCVRVEGTLLIVGRKTGVVLCTYFALVLYMNAVCSRNARLLVLPCCELGRIVCGVYSICFINFYERDYALRRPPWADAFHVFGTNDYDATSPASCVRWLSWLLVWFQKNCCRRCGQSDFRQCSVSNSYFITNTSFSPDSY